MHRLPSSQERRESEIRKESNWFKAKIQSKSKQTNVLLILVVSYIVTSNNFMLIGMDSILEILETAICSAFVKDSIPVSVILIGPSGAGKSQALLIYDSGRIPSVHRSDDLTAAGIFDICLKDKENKIAHILCPDFNIPMSHKDSVVSGMSAKMMGLMSDGIVRIDDGRSNKEISHRQTGLLTAMTGDVYIGHSKKWSALGFKRRFLPIFFDYSAKTRSEVQAKIRNGHPVIIEIKRNPLSAKPVLTEIQIKPNSKQAFAIESLSITLATNLAYYPKRDRKTGEIEAAPGHPFIEYSPHHVLRTMARAHALRDKRRVVLNKDVDFLAGMIDFCKYGSPIRI